MGHGCSPEGFATASEYVRSLIREDQKRRAKEELGRVLLDALDTGQHEVTPQAWASIEAKLEDHINKIRK